LLGNGEYAADSHLLKLQRLQNRVLRAVGSLDRCTQVCELHAAFKISPVYDYITESWGTQADVIPNHTDPDISGAGQACEVYKRFKLGFGHA
jgi:hypothetical protein